MKDGTSLTLLVKGSCTVCFGATQHSKMSMKATASAGEITPAICNETKSTADCTENGFTFTYKGGEATLVFTASKVDGDTGNDIYTPCVTLTYTTE